MKNIALAAAIFGSMGSYALADSSNIQQDKGPFVLSDAQMDNITAGKAPTGYRTNSKSTNYYTEYSYNYNPDTYTWDTIEGNTYKTTTRNNYSSKTKQVK